MKSEAIFGIFMGVGAGLVLIAFIFFAGVGWGQTLLCENIGGPESYVEDSGMGAKCMRQKQPQKFEQVGVRP